MSTQKITSYLIASVLLLLSFQGVAQPERFLPGRDYTVIANPAVDRTPDLVEVTEYFWYGCPGCFQFEPQLADWIEQQDDNVVCLRLPAIWDDWREIHARAYYIADSLGVLGDMHRKIFDAMHLQGKRLRNEQELQELFADNGIDPADFSKAYGSFTVTTAINRAKTLATQYMPRSTPSMIVNGKYLVGPSRDMLDIVDFLVRKESL